MKWNQSCSHIEASNIRGTALTCNYSVILTERERVNAAAFSLCFYRRKCDLTQGLVLAYTWYTWANSRCLRSSESPFMMKHLHQTLIESWYHFHLGANILSTRYKTSKKWGNSYLTYKGTPKAFWHFPPIFVLSKLTRLVTLFDRKLHLFKSSPNWAFLAVLMNFCLIKMRSQCWMRLFLWFSNTVPKL